ncbi:hypothetical protein BOTBODRAFT_31050 [Botryobasidium botryosum FD-172 SS1]|uniref:Methyltransferase domain-containing protein n=1 Tax=Botryobasidium botryosum (strain FD-172 SS1) TaxID=930990 RepID=A0A067MNU4_BOTB1|nr:hypothetical protein BOTBODRAFT_31050 [Botryobasidium botryosum FD-172 SS1]
MASKFTYDPYRPHAYYRHYDDPVSPDTTSAGDRDDDARSESTSGTPAPSVYSFRSSVDGKVLLREAQGRKFNTQNDLYFLPADEQEYARLDMQHRMHLKGIDGLYIRKDDVRKVLAPDSGAQKAILDVGCGTGAWAIGMAEEFPHAQVVGIDLAPCTSRPLPDNCRLEFDDVTLGMSHYHNCFDLIHLRCVGNGVKDYPALIEDLSKCLRLGGILLIVEADLQVLNSHKEPIEPAFRPGKPNQSWVARICFEAYNTMKARGSSMDCGRQLLSWLKNEPLLKGEEYQKLHFPIGPWEKNRKDEKRAAHLEEVGELCRRSMKEFSRSVRPLLISEGYFPEIVDKIIRCIDDELSTLSVHTYTQWHYFSAQKRKPSA